MMSARLIAISALICVLISCGDVINVQGEALLMILGCACAYRIINHEVIGWGS